VTGSIENKVQRGERASVTGVVTGPWQGRDSRYLLW